MTRSESGFDRWLTLFDPLEDRKLYSFGCLADFGAAHLNLDGAGCTYFKQRLRLYLVRLAMIDEFPRNGDGALFLHQIMATPAWWGARWRDAAHAHLAQPEAGPSNDKPFAPEHQHLQLVLPHWSREDLLAVNGLFHLNDLALPLGIDPDHIRTIALNRSDPWAYMGVRLVLDQWLVHMRTFAAWLEPRTRSISP